MEAFSTMMLPGDLPPVGNMISLQARAGCLLEDRLSGYKYWLDSGTSALALALLDAKAHFPDLDKPRAIIPGYCCPDLIAACVYAGVEPVAVDININDPSYDLDQLRQHLDVSVIAVIAINFLGISERLDELQQLIARLGLRTRLIEDNAQWFPSIEEEMDFKSDYVTFSFGRGKPMSLLGGGLLSARRPVAASVLACIEKATRKQKLLALKIIAYNFLLTPQLYMLLNRNPWLRLGETKYVPLAQIAYMDDYRRSLLDSNFKLHSQRHNDLQRSYDQAVSSGGMQQLDSLCTLRRKQLLRYPLLCPDAVSRDNLLERMRAHGLGATSMYALPIDQIAGVNGLVIVPGLLKNANSFAARFMTMPIHSGVSQAYQKRMWVLIKG
jgi:dTDP-4-amino-4,6-dideoxygalactose transaminase